jgi:hypothetical protein
LFLLIVSFFLFVEQLKKVLNRKQISFSVKMLQKYLNTLLCPSLTFFKTSTMAKKKSLDLYFTLKRSSHFVELVNRQQKIRRNSGSSEVDKIIKCFYLRRNFVKIHKICGSEHGKEERRKNIIYKFIYLPCFWRIEPRARWEILFLTKYLHKFTCFPIKRVKLISDIRKAHSNMLKMYNSFIGGHMRSEKIHDTKSRFVGQVDHHYMEIKSERVVSLSSI